MPASSASRGEPKATGAPSTRNAPLVGRCTPDSVLIRVDLPAPLSPRRHRTSPPRTVIETPASAITGPKCLTMLRTSMRGGSATMLTAMSALPSDLLADEVVEQNREQQHGAEKDLEPVRI